MLKSIRFFTKVSLENFLTIPCFSIGVPIYSMLVFSDRHNAVGTRNTLFFLLCCGMICTVVGMALYSTYLQLALTNGTTRKGVFLGATVWKFIFSLLTCAAVFVTLISYHRIFTLGFTFTFDFTFFLVLFCAAILCFSLGETLGLVSIRFGKIVYIVFVIVLTICGGITGLLVAMNNFNGIATGMISFFTSSVAAPIGTMLIVSAVLSGINWLLVRRSTVRMI